MLGGHTGGVTRIADWEYGGVVYYLHLGRGPRTGGHLTVLALGPAATYRCMVVGPHAAEHTVRMVLAAPDPASRSGTVECLLAMREALIH